MRLLVLIYLMLNLVNFRTKINKIKTVSVYLNYCDIYFKNKKQIIQSSLILGSFIVAMLMLGTVCFNNNGLDLKIYYNFLFKSLVFYEQVVLLLVILTFFSLIRKYTFVIVKLHYFKLHYYYFVRFIIYNTIIRFVKKKEVLNDLFVKKKPQYYKIFKAFGYILSIILIKNLIFDDFVLNTKLILCYGLYRLIFNIFNHIRLNLNYDFEQGVIQHYFPDEFCLTEFGILRLNVYLVNLVCEPLKYYPMPNYLVAKYYELNMYFDPPRDWIFFSYDYKEIDVYQLLKTKTPRIPEQKYL